MKTSKLICKIIKNENKIDSPTLLKYINTLVELGYIEVEGLEYKLTRKGESYAR